MPKLPKRLCYEAAIAAALLLGSCSNRVFNDAQTDAISEIADASAEAAISDSDKVKDLTDRVEAIEDKLGM